ncbi:hypothetical protein Syn7502_01116 [Synechococcus sp. PCC 7502]|uniref:hypothetical protein n=1 Tax=Synechococcus sp. PCC 7502 TaxID=1173263 RepID=UPI00029F9A02|nr:hypothetical protein [Synechococcus sp. PCC 7502]AFY73225.1 hypothetical protein Syn7502_01116 [Synechococcus sp. PCC 7502]
MQQLPILIKDKFFKYLNGSEPITEFEPWIYQTKVLEDILSKDDYLYLISLDFSNKWVKYKIDNILRRYIDLGEYETWKLKHLLFAFINEDGNPQQLLDDIYDLYYDGYYFLESLGLGYELCLESWADLSRSQELDSFLQRARGEAQEVLSWLETNKIVIKTAHDDRNHFSVIDTRTEKEKKPTWYKLAKFSNRQQSQPWWKFWG